MKLDYESTEPDVRIEIIPLIDVIFCILTFFILAAVTLTRQAAINVDLPQAASGATQMRQTLIVSVDPIGQTYVEKLPVTQDQLYQSILKFREQNPDGMMVLYASRSASYNDVVQVLDLLRSAGGDRVALATLPGEGPASSQGGQGGQGGQSNQIPVPGNSPSGNPNDLLFPSAPAPNSTIPQPGGSFNFGNSPTPGRNLPSGDLPNGNSGLNGNSPRPNGSSGSGNSNSGGSPLNQN
jgi:biopolymer transport protein ExbD